jgi:hypothetical protein
MEVAADIASPSLCGSVDAIFQPQPHGVIADNPLIGLACPTRLNKMASLPDRRDNGNAAIHFAVSEHRRSGFNHAGFLHLQESDGPNPLGILSRS